MGVMEMNWLSTRNISNAYTIFTQGFQCPFALSSPVAGSTGGLYCNLNWTLCPEVSVDALAVAALPILEACICMKLNSYCVLVSLRACECLSIRA